jgi:hypothetical protein
MGGDGRVTSVDPLPADFPGELLDPLGQDVQFGQFGRETMPCALMRLLEISRPSFSRR